MALDTEGRHPGTAHFKNLFNYEHLPPHLAEVSKPFHELAQKLIDEVQDGPELSAALRKMLEAKDCVVRQRLQDTS